MIKDMNKEIFVKPVGSDLHINLGGFYNASGSKDYSVIFYQEYTKGVASIPNRNKVVVDCTKLKVFPADVVPNVEEGLKVYKKDFKSCVMKVAKGSAILRIQLQKMCDNVGLPVVMEEVEI